MHESVLLQEVLDGLAPMLERGGWTWRDGPDRFNHHLLTYGGGKDARTRTYLYRLTVSRYAEPGTPVEPEVAALKAPESARSPRASSRTKG